MKIYNFLKTYVGATFTAFASVCSILGLMLMFINNQLASIIALSVFCLGFMILNIWNLKGYQ